MRDKINEIFDNAYSKDLSVCPNHTIFQRQKALNELLTLLEDYVKLADDQKLPRSPWAEALDANYADSQLETSAYYTAQYDMWIKGFRRVELKEEVE